MDKEKFLEYLERAIKRTEEDDSPITTGSQVREGVKRGTVVTLKSIKEFVEEGNFDD